MSFDTIYYFPVLERKMPDGMVEPAGPKNNGYDTNNGDYIVNLHDHINYRFEIIAKIGKGSFGSVLKCVDHKCDKNGSNNGPWIVALKIIWNKPRLQRQGLVEVDLLEHMKNNDVADKMNIVWMIEHFSFRNHMCITFEMLSINLYEYIKVHNFLGFDEFLVCKFTVQILKSLKYMKEHNIIHCDLKPENILLWKAEGCKIKVIDFGSSCFADKSIYTYIQSRYYWAPEIILGVPYTTAIDMWSVGCIAYELYTGYPLFAGEDEQHQLSLIM